MNKIIKLVSFIISLSIIIFCFYTPVVNCKETVITEGYIFGNNVNIRKSPSTSSGSSGRVSTVNTTVLGSKKDSKNTINPETKKEYIWYNVTLNYLGEDITGYVREDLIDIHTYTIADTFKEQLALFPKSYKSYLKELNEKYPNWVFISEKVPQNFADSVALQDNLFYKLVKTDYNSLRSLRKGCYNWSTGKFVETDSGGWYGASREVIAFYMDPRNFLNINNIFIFMQQSYDSKIQTLDSVKDIVKDTFLDSKISDKNDEYYNKSYAEVILIAAKKSLVNPLVLAATILQEQGTKGSTLSKGAEYNKTTVYNFFNFGAAGSTALQVLNSGKEFAYSRGWTTPSKSIIGGAISYENGYHSRGQDTYFYKNFNVLHPYETNHQYAQNVADSVNSAKFLKNIYSEMNDAKLYFRIPVFEDLPTDVSTLPKSNSKLNNYYFSDIDVDGLTPSFNRYTYEYSLSISGNTTVTLKLPKGASFVSDESVSVKKGQKTIKLKVKSETGYFNTYVLNVEALKSSTITFSHNSVVTSTVQKGDCTGDGKITILDLANVRLHLLDIIKLKGNNLKGADTNSDDKVTILDLANIRLHLLGITKIK